jgi:hypothetical protein
MPATVILIITAMVLGSLCVCGGCIGGIVFCCRKRRQFNSNNGSSMSQAQPGSLPLQKGYGEHISYYTQPSKSVSYEQNSFSTAGAYISAQSNFAYPSQEYGQQTNGGQHVMSQNGMVAAPGSDRNALNWNLYPTPSMGVTGPSAPYEASSYNSPTLQNVAYQQTNGKSPYSIAPL